MDLLALLSQPELTTEAALARLLLALVAGGIVGIEREIRRQTAGLRTHILICLGATLLMLLSIWMPQSFGYDKGDPGRIAAQVVSGIGFLGAGAFIKIGNNMKGLTTAASIWVVAAIGMAIGAGMWGPGLIGLGLVIGTLSLLEPVERHFFPTERIKVLRIDYDEKTMNRKKLFEVLKSHKVRLQSLDAVQSMTKKQTRLNLLVRVPISVDVEALFHDLKVTGKVSKIRMEENY